jgi:hypothetical protein
MPSKPRKTAAPKNAGTKIVTERVEVPGVRPANFKLKEWAPDSFQFFRSSRKIGTAAAEGAGWSAKFNFGGKDWKASADSAQSLLRLVGTFILANEGREAAAQPVKPEPARKGKRQQSEDEAISLEFLKRAQDLRLAAIDAQIAECRKLVKPA